MWKTEIEDTNYFTFRKPAYFPPYCPPENSNFATGLQIYLIYNLYPSDPPMFYLLSSSITDPFYPINMPPYVASNAGTFFWAAYYPDYGYAGGRHIQNSSGTVDYPYCQNGCFYKYGWTAGQNGYAKVIEGYYFVTSQVFDFRGFALLANDWSQGNMPIDSLKLWTEYWQKDPNQIN